MEGSEIDGEFEIQQCNWDEIEINEIAQLMHDVRKEEGFPEFPVDRIANYIQRIRERFPAEVTFLARNAGGLIGWASIHRSTESIGELDRWHPFVKGSESQTLGRTLLERCNDYSRRNGITRLTCTLSELADNLEEAYQKRREWFDASGWSKMNEDIYMVWDVTAEGPAEAPLSEEYSIAALSSRTKMELYHCYEEAFLEGDDREIHDMTPVQRRERFEEHFDLETIVEESSVIIENDGEISAFILVKAREDEHHIDLIGVRPKHRRKGLAKVLVERAKNVGAKAKIGTMTLGVDSVNQSAYKLYKSCGFAVATRMITYSWNS